MYYDRAAAAKEKERKKAYETLKEKLKVDNPDAHRYLLQQEMDMATMEQKIRKYQNFFSMLRELLPKEFDMNTPLM